MEKRSRRGFLYAIGKTAIIVRNRPYSLEPDANKFLDEDHADAYLSVTDTFTVGIPGKHLVWCPWNEGQAPTKELIYACNKVLNFWVHYLKLDFIQVFCDAGSHRSPSIFGMYLLTFFPNEAEDIVKNRVGLNIRSQDKTQSDPLEYAKKYLNKNPELWLLLKAMREDYLGRLDLYCSRITDRVCSVYGD